jgi:multidrug resistance efflux pump
MPAQLEVRSEEIQEIMGAVPRKLIRWGSMAVFLVLAALLTGAYFFPYPDVISTRVRLQVKHPPQLVRPETSGTLTTLPVPTGRYVQAGDLLFAYQPPSGPPRRQLAPRTGQLQWLVPLQPGDQLEPGTSLMAVVDTTRQYVATADISPNVVGKIRPGLPITLKLNAYPAAEYGTLQGQVYAISPVPVDSLYRVSILLPRSSFYTKNPTAQPQESVLWGTGQIITSQKRLLLRLFEKA